MKIILSPAKSLNFEIDLPSTHTETPIFEKEAMMLLSVLKKKSQKEIKSLMGLSDNLADLNWRRYKEIVFPHTPQNAKPCLFVFRGDVYVGFEARTLPLEKYNYVKKHLRILSGFYGILRPFDLIQPYRLEMGTKLAVGKHDNLYGLWKSKLTSYIEQELEEAPTLLNLASKEYFSALDLKHLSKKTKIISPRFRENRNGTMTMISFFTKQARGSLARFLADHNISNHEDIKAFDYNNYSYSERHTKDEDSPVFIR